MHHQTKPAPQDYLNALTRAECYPHPVTAVRMIETHISWVYLTGTYAYKIKKPVKLGFLDFSTLAARRRYCEEELRLNRRLAADLYLEVVEIRGTPDAPRIGGTGPLLDYAVKMQQFSQDALASRALARGELTPDHLVQLAGRIASFHASASRQPPGECGTPETILHRALHNFDEIAALLTDARDRGVMNETRRWTEHEYEIVRALLTRRRESGMVREGHGDLHLGNIVLIDGTLIPFDCIEFSEELRWNDVLSETAFLMMDLMDRGATELGYLFLNAYLEHTGDYEGLPVLRFYLVYRAVVRAMVHLIRARQARGNPAEEERLLAAYRTYMRLAATCARRDKPALVLMHGFSGSGKSTVALQLAQVLGAVRLRSDIERKRLAGMAAHERSASAIGAGLYATNADEATYDRLALVAYLVLQAGYRVLVDAAFLKRWQRERLFKLTGESRIPLLLLRIEAPHEILRSRIVQRAARGTDASEAGLGVLDHQLTHREPLAEHELRHAMTVDGNRPLALETCEGIARAVGVPLQQVRARCRRLRIRAAKSAIQ